VERICCVPFDVLWLPACMHVSRLLVNVSTAPHCIQSEPAAPVVQPTRVLPPRTCRFAQGLSQDAIKLALRVLTDTAGKQLKLRQACTVDLGVGQLRFAAGAGLAEFAPRSGWQQQQQQPRQAPLPVPSLQSSADAVSKPQGILAHSAAASHCSSSSSQQHSSSSAPAAPQAPRSSKTSANASSTVAVLGAAKRLAAPRAAAATAGISTAAVPEKPSNCDYDAAAAWEIAREVRTAAAQNARVKPAAFVLPAGGPCDEEGQPRMPQGKGKYAAPTQSQQQVSSLLDYLSRDCLWVAAGKFHPARPCMACQPCQVAVDALRSNHGLLSPAGLQEGCVVKP
jgi:hypothetical protein